MSVAAPHLLGGHGRAQRAREVAHRLVLQVVEAGHAPHHRRRDAPALLLLHLAAARVLVPAQKGPSSWFSLLRFLLLSQNYLVASGAPLQNTRRGDQGKPCTSFEGCRTSRLPLLTSGSTVAELFDAQQSLKGTRQPCSPASFSKPVRVAGGWRTWRVASVDSTMSDRKALTASGSVASRS